jgi:hypothetical protein
VVLGALGKRETDNGIAMLEPGERRAVRGQSVRVAIGAIVIAATIALACAYLPCI